MSHLLAEHHFVTVASYRLLTLRDQDCDAGVNADHAIDEAAENIAASTGYELYINCAQDLFAITVRIAIWDDEPSIEQQGRTQTGRILTLICPTGELVLDSPTGEALALELPSGSGTYAISVRDEGRTEAIVLRQNVLKQTDTPAGEDLHTAAQRYGGIERYTIDMWRTGR
ncbi:hypothetical protein [Amycolatopsis aidingensis]|uniref:hypothetical protein n=1 Tax=Amycolatopsis aidingensis TaxID=2842453 RepID=UPI001C0B60CE|nr:hypothetical protein [Amycolatopsis aidingensis]